MNRSYAGIGSRKSVSDHILDQMELIGEIAATNNWILRSGGAKGSDTAFETGCDKVRGQKEIFLPWKEFNCNPSPLYAQSPDAFKLAAEVHPAWNNLNSTARKLIARNMHQILGEHLNDPVKFVVCYTQDSCESYLTYGPDTGGTGSAICLASLLDIPVFNLKNLESYDKVVELLISCY